MLNARRAHIRQLTDVRSGSRYKENLSNAAGFFMRFGFMFCKFIERR